MSTITFSSEAETTVRRSRRSTFRSWSLPVLVLILTTPFLLRAWFIAGVPDIRPFDEDAFCKVEIPDEQNAFTFYRKAGHQAEKILAARTADKRDRTTANRWKIGEKGPNFLKRFTFRHAKSSLKLT